MNVTDTINNIAKNEMKEEMNKLTKSIELYKDQINDWEKERDEIQENIMQAIEKMKILQAKKELLWKAISG
jgi:DNA anti-recombination protein RmuC